MSHSSEYECHPRGAPSDPRIHALPCPYDFGRINEHDKQYVRAKVMRDRNIDVMTPTTFGARQQLQRKHWIQQVMLDGHHVVWDGFKKTLTCTKTARTIAPPPRWAADAPAACILIGELFYSSPLAKKDTSTEFLGIKSALNKLWRSASSADDSEWIDHITLYAYDVLADATHNEPKLANVEDLSFDTRQRILSHIVRRHGGESVEVIQSYVVRGTDFRSIQEELELFRSRGAKGVVFKRRDGVPSTAYRRGQSTDQWMLYNFYSDVAGTVVSISKGNGCHVQIGERCVEVPLCNRRLVRVQAGDRVKVRIYATHANGDRLTREEHACIVESCDSHSDHGSAVSEAQLESKVDEFGVCQEMVGPNINELTPAEKEQSVQMAIASGTKRQREAAQKAASRAEYKRQEAVLRQQEVDQFDNTLAANNLAANNLAANTLAANARVTRSSRSTPLLSGLPETKTIVLHTEMQMQGNNNMSLMPKPVATPAKKEAKRSSNTASYSFFAVGVLSALTPIFEAASWLLPLNGQRNHTGEVEKRSAKSKADVVANAAAIASEKKQQLQFEADDKQVQAVKATYDKETKKYDDANERASDARRAMDAAVADIKRGGPANAVLDAADTYQVELDASADAMNRARGALQKLPAQHATSANIKGATSAAINEWRLSKQNHQRVQRFKDQYEAEMNTSADANQRARVAHAAMEIAVRNMNPDQSSTHELASSTLVDDALARYKAEVNEAQSAMQRANLTLQSISSSIITNGAAESAIASMVIAWPALQVLVNKTEEITAAGIPALCLEYINEAKMNAEGTTGLLLYSAKLARYNPIVALLEGIGFQSDSFGGINVLGLVILSFATVIALVLGCKFMYKEEAAAAMESTTIAISDVQHLITSDSDDDDDSGELRQARLTSGPGDGDESDPINYETIIKDINIINNALATLLHRVHVNKKR